MAYLKVNWPEIRDYMDNPDYPEDCYYDPLKDAWFIPEEWDMECIECEWEENLNEEVLYKI